MCACECVQPRACEPEPGTIVHAEAAGPVPYPILSHAPFGYKRHLSGRACSPVVNFGFAWFCPLISAISPEIGLVVIDCDWGPVPLHGSSPLERRRKWISRFSVISPLSGLIEVSFK